MTSIMSVQFKSTSFKRNSPNNSKVNLINGLLHDLTKNKTVAETMNINIRKQTDVFEVSSFVGWPV